jgi:hypothetical protein
MHITGRLVKLAQRKSPCNDPLSHKRFFSQMPNHSQSTNDVAEQGERTGMEGSQSSSAPLRVVRAVRQVTVSAFGEGRLLDWSSDRNCARVSSSRRNILKAVILSDLAQ